MIPESDINIICHYAKEYGVTAIFLFGSSLRDPRSAHDIDLGVIGIEPGRFFSFYGELLMKLNKPVDLIDLSKPSKFSALVIKRGKKIYG
jgi:predicted nucleotidyltransferase